MQRSFMHSPDICFVGRNTDQYVMVHPHKFWIVNHVYDLGVILHIDSCMTKIFVSDLQCQPFSGRVLMINCSAVVDIKNSCCSFKSYYCYLQVPTCWPLPTSTRKIRHAIGLWAAIRSAFSNVSFELRCCLFGFCLFCNLNVLRFLTAVNWIWMMHES
jgi:hypothetical protein